MTSVLLEYVDMEKAVRGYFDACNKADRERFSMLFADDAIHYLPAGMFGPIHGVAHLADRWVEDVVKMRASWSIDNLAIDTRRNEAMVEWTALKPALCKLFRGVDWFVFNEDGLIQEVRVYYATARDESREANELGGFPYKERGWAVADYELG